MQINIRRATGNDRDTLVRFNRALAQETEDKALELETVRVGVDAVLADTEKGFYLIAEVDGHPTAALLITTEWSDWRNAYFWWIQSVFVLPEHRKLGIYSRLHRQVEVLARLESNVCGIRLYVDRNNTQAKATYERLGMTPARYDFYESTLRTKRSN